MKLIKQFFANRLLTAFDEMHAIVTVCAGVLSDIPAPSAASRATLLVLTSCMTVPQQTKSISSLGTPVLLMRLTRAARWRSCGQSFL